MGLVHEALLYHGDTELTGAVQEFAAEAAVADEPLLVALPGINLQAVRDALGDASPGSRFEDMYEVGRNPAHLLALLEEWMSGHRGRAHIVAESLWPGRNYPETVECLRHEALLNDALADRPATIMTAFDADHLDAETLAGAELTHPVVIEGGRRRASTAYGGPGDAELAARWPMEPPSEPVSRHQLGDSVCELRHAIADDPLVAQLEDERRADLVLAVSEAASNTLRHGDGWCAARVWHDGRSVVTEVSCRTAVADRLAGRRRPTPDARSGRGLWLINQVCDLVELRTGEDGTTLRMHMEIVA